jgi:ferredoxin
VKVFADQDKCIASGLCNMTAPDVFDQRDEDGIVVLLNAEPGEDRQDDVHHAATVCPALAITVED